MENDYLSIVPAELREEIEELEEKGSCYFINKSKWPRFCEKDGQELDMGMMRSACYGEFADTCWKLKSTLDILDK